MFDGEALGKQLTVVVRDFLTRSLAVVTARMDGFEQRIASIPAGKDGAPGINGNDGERGSDGVPGKDGAQGADGPAGAEGKQGEVGAQGEPGIAGKDGAPGAPGERGADGINGKDGAAGVDGASGKDGANGIDGKSLTVDDIRPMFEAEQAKWALEFERRAMDVLQRACDRMPVPKDGVNGLSIEDLTVTDDGDGNVTLKFARGEVVREHTVRLPRFKYCGVFRDGAYRKGDATTWGGSLWLAAEDAPPGRPGTEACGWQLAVKCGKDGKDGMVVGQRAPEVIRLK